MKKQLRIAVADDEPDMQQYFEKILPRLGHEVVAVAGDGRELVRQCHAQHPDLVITDIRMPEMDGLQAAEELYRDTPIPVILVSAYHDSDLIHRAGADHIFAYLVKPIKQGDLEPAIGLAVRRFEQFQALQQEASNVRQALQDRKTIESASETLMTRGNLTAPEAFDRLRQLAREKNQKLVEVAHAILADKLTR